jgi:hypothetical protein
MKYRKGYKYQLVSLETFKTEIIPESAINTQFIMVSKTGTVFIKSGYAWDGSSGPTRDTKTNMRGSLLHDALYQLLRMGLLDQKWRKQADREFIKVCKEDGMWSLRQKWTYDGLQVAQGTAALPKNKKKVYEV